MKDVAFCVGVKYGDSKVWDKILGVYVDSESASDRQSAQLALACSKDPTILSKYRIQYVHFHGYLPLCVTMTLYPHLLLFQFK